MSGGGTTYDEGGVLRYAPAPKAPVKRSRALVSRILSFLLRAPPARARRQAMKARVRAWEQAMKGVLYIIPADPTAIRERCEITVPPTVEELRKIIGGYIGIVHGFTSIDIYGDGLAMPCVAFCNEDGKRLGLPVNWQATGMWHDALVRKGSRGGLLAEGGGCEDYLVGAIVVISGDSKLMDELFTRLL
jgi:hypothetical protein